MNWIHEVIHLPCTFHIAGEFNSHALWLPLSTSTGPPQPSLQGPLSRVESFQWLGRGLIIIPASFGQCGAGNQWSAETVFLNLITTTLVTNYLTSILPTGSLTTSLTSSIAQIHNSVVFKDKYLRSSIVFIQHG